VRGGYAELGEDEASCVLRACWIRRVAIGAVEKGIFEFYPKVNTGLSE